MSKFSRHSGPIVFAILLAAASASPALAEDEYNVSKGYTLDGVGLGVHGVDPVVLSSEPEVNLALTSRSGPVEIEIDYRVDPEHAREFFRAMQDVGRTRRRNGGFGWSLGRDIADPALWTERYHCPTWGDYLRMRDRYTQADFAIQEEADGFNRSGSMSRVRRRLERPFGSVRWKADSYDPQQETIGFITP